MSHSRQNNASSLSLAEYRDAIHLDTPVPTTESNQFTEAQYEQSIHFLLEYFESEGKLPLPTIPDTISDQRKLLHAIQNVRQPAPLTEPAIEAFDFLLAYEKKQKVIVQSNQLPTLKDEGITVTSLPIDKLILWRGDITTLDVDAIVNAANAQMLGCFQPFHACIDNAIHTAAGPQLREDCYIIMELQGHTEKTGDAKITRAYHLPSRYVLHTVGPIIPQGTKLQSEQEDQLAACYTSCLDLAAQVDGIRSIAFCAISTGVFGYPKVQAASNALKTVSDWVQSNPERFDYIIFNVFSDEDEQIYRDEILGHHS